MVESISKVVVSDLLSKLDLKPWWEKYRGYCFAVSVAAALSMTYMLQTISLSCVPDANSTNVMFTTPIANFVNTLCISTLPTQFLYAGPIALLCCGLLLAISTFWLHIPKVIDAFETYLRIKKVIEELNLTTERLKELSLTPYKSDDNEGVLKVREACDQLWYCKAKCKIRKIYILRSILLCVTSIGTLVAEIWMLFNLIPKRDGIVFCHLQRHEISPMMNTTTYTCTADTAPLIILLTITFLLSIILYLFFVCFGIWMTWNLGDLGNIHLTSHWKKVVELIRFSDIFWRNSRPVTSTSCHGFFNLVTNSAPEQLIKSLETTYPRRTVPPQHAQNVIHSIELCSTLVSDWAITAKFVGYFWDLFRYNDSQYSRLRGIIANGRTMKCSDDVKDLLLSFWEAESFELFVGLLNIKSSGDELDKFLKSLGLNLDNIGFMDKLTNSNHAGVGQSNEKGCSILYHALCKKIDGTIHKTAALRIMRYRNSCNEKAYVHHDGLSYSVSRFAKLQKLPGFGGGAAKDELDHELRRAIRDNTDFKDEPKSGFEKILKIKKECEEQGYENKKRDITGPHGEFWEKIVIKISIIKFTPWNEEINEFARDLDMAKLWTVLVTLMNAFIVEHNEHNSEIKITDFVIEKCRLDFNDANMQPTTDVETLKYGVRRQTPTLLGKALRKPPAAPFVFTAVATILSLTKEKMKKSQCQVQKLYELVTEYSGLLPHQQKILLSVIED